MRRVLPLAWLVLSCTPALAGCFNGHWLPALPMGSLASLSSGCLFFSACVAYISPRMHSAAGELLWCGLWTKGSAWGLFSRGLSWVSKCYFWSSLGERWSGIQPWSIAEASAAVSALVCAGSAAGGGSVREDPVSCRRALARSPDSRVLRKHSSYSIGLLLLPGNTLSTFRILVLVAPILAQQICPTAHG